MAIAIMVLGFKAGISYNVVPAHIDAANATCKPNGGLKYLSVGGTYVNITCKTGGEFQKRKSNIMK